MKRFVTLSFCNAPAIQRCLDGPWRSSMVRLVAIVVLASPFSVSAEPLGDAKVVLDTPGLVAFWNFGEAAGDARLALGGDQSYRLQEVGGPIQRVAGGPFSALPPNWTENTISVSPTRRLGNLTYVGHTRR